MNKILKYTFFDLSRSRWSYLYFGFYLVFALALLFVSGDIPKVLVSLMNVLLVLSPLIATMFGVMYYYNSREFIELLLAQPVRRSHIFIGQYLGLALSLSLSLILGLGIPLVIYGILTSSQVWNFLVLLWDGVALSFIFSGLAFWLALLNENKIRGFGLAILLWLFFAVIYDGIFLLLLLWFRDYPLESFSIGLTLFNPIDLSRILVLLKLDVSALMGYSGAVIKKFLGSGSGMLFTLGAMLLWIALPLLGIRRTSIHKDF